MLIGLYNLEPYPNTAMMQVSQYHKQKGDQVELYSPLFHQKYDKVYAFSIFDFTSKRYVRSDMICGGTGFNLTTKLPPEIEACDLDYSIFPNCKTSYIWFSRGCFRKCPYCVVPQKEGSLRPVLPKNLNPNGEYVSVMDNNFFANPSYNMAIKQLIEWNQPVDLQQGIDVKIFNSEQAKSLENLKMFKQIRIAWDNPKENLRDDIRRFLDYFSSSNVMCYVLVGYWSTEEQDLERIMWLEKQGIDPYVMPYNRHDPYQKALRNWCNRKARMKKVSWEEYRKESLGHACSKCRLWNYSAVPS